VGQKRGEECLGQVGQWAKAQGWVEIRLGGKCFDGVVFVCRYLAVVDAQIKILRAGKPPRPSKDIVSLVLAL
jgi:hypothetical protein